MMHFDKEAYWEQRNLPPALRQKISRMERMNKWGDGIITKRYTPEEWDDLKNLESHSRVGKKVKRRRIESD